MFAITREFQEIKFFGGLAKRGKTTTGWFYGFKLHLIINEKGEILSFLVTPGNVSDVSVLEALSKDVSGSYLETKDISLPMCAQKLLEQRSSVVTPLKKI